MTRVLILGAGGMLGHKLCQQFRNRFDTWATVRSSPSNYSKFELLDEARLMGGVDAANLDSVMRAVATVQPDVVINCVGIIKQLAAAKDPIASLTINSLFPHRLALLCRSAGIRMMHISTDCVFSGRKGMYSEDDPSDAEDLYGRSKFLGEVSAEGSLTLRTSIIGRELETISGLVEWFLSNRGGHVRGFTKAIYSGFTTLALADIMAELIESWPHLSGVYQVSSEPIDKYALLLMLRDAFGIDIEVEPYADFVIDRSLDSSHFRSTTKLALPTWQAMIQTLAQDTTPYDRWR